MLEPNDHLRRARERVQSPSDTGSHLTRQELADLVNARIADRDPKAVLVTETYIGKLEQGRIRWPQQEVRREAFRYVLHASTDADLGFRRPVRSRSTVEDVDRQQFIRAAVGLGAAAVAGLPTKLDLLAPNEPTPVPTVVGLSEVEGVRNAAKAFEGWDALYGGGLVREAVMAQLRHSAQLLDAKSSDHVRRRLFSAVGYLSHVTGFMAFDAYAHGDARRMFRFALACAEESGDWHLRAKILSSMARQAIWCGDPDAGLTFTELALVRADRLTATERAMLHTARARALAKLQRVQDTLEAVGAADDEFVHSDPKNDPVWMRYYDRAQHLGDTGHALWDIAIDNHFVGEARSRLAAAVDGHGEQFARARAISQTKLSSLVMVAGDPIEAASLGSQAVEWSGSIRSRRAADDMRDLRKMADRHKTLPEVVELQHRIGSAVVLT